MENKPFGYIILRNLKFKVKSPNSTEWEQMESGFELDFVRKKLYKRKESAEDAMKQLKKHSPTDEFEIRPVYKQAETVMGRCRHCKWWRDKGWVGDEGIGICDNPQVIRQVSVMKEEMIIRFVREQSEARMIANSQRFHSDFGCIHFEGNAIAD